MTLNISAKEYTIEFSEDFFLFEKENIYDNGNVYEYYCICVDTESELCQYEFYDYLYIFYSSFDVEYLLPDPAGFQLPCYIIDVISSEYEVEEFSYEINSSLIINEDILLGLKPLPVLTGRSSNFNSFNFLEKEISFPITEFAKYDLHEKKDRKMFFISPFMYDPYTKKLEMITSLTIDVKKLKKIETSIEDVAEQNVDVYVSETGINVSAESDGRQNVRIYDVSGRMVCSTDFVREITIDKSGLDKGVYIIHLTEPNGNSQNFKVVI